MSPPYYWEGHENEGFKVHNFEHLIHYVVEQEVVTHGIRISKGVKPILITKQENVILPRIEPTIAKGVPMAIKVRYNEPRVNQ